MITVQTFHFNMMQENTYVVHDDSKQAVIIDCGASNEQEFDVLAEYVEEKKLQPVLSLATHGHFDHNYGADFLYRQWNLPVRVHEKDAILLKDFSGQLQTLTGFPSEEMEVHLGKYLEEEENILWGNHTFHIIPSPGHTHGGVCFYCEQEHILFSGDTLFNGTIGRTDLPYGSMFKMTNSLRRLCQLPDETIIYPGHGAPTSIALELSHNPFLDR